MKVPAVHLVFHAPGVNQPLRTLCHRTMDEPVNNILWRNGDHTIMVTTKPANVTCKTCLRGAKHA